MSQTTVTDREMPDRCPLPTPVNVTHVEGFDMKIVRTAVRDVVFHVTVLLVASMAVIVGVATWVICAHVATTNGYLRNTANAVREGTK